ncbi:uncharacterized protein PV07_01746 [Cladophialophora immunda]|uniref:BZIP domain-containing protein n=1 Tax=Cladophialophora immunda TaxID=569365 RepID=A0A0D2DGZ8_9EURO|nr:uncharacterized protein PV07_01746 [Cladophialophora immunda]KIW35019.1 hypothetical protein PV07_01746 [Cladophialophora immunda]OQV10581.1 hypothetical protein CLAIMM_14558 [Cladophialophora immunda]
MKEGKTGQSDPSKSSQAASTLALKRARDRRAQQAMRDRAKAEIGALRDQVSQLSERLRVQESTYSRDVSHYIRENHELRRRVEDLHLYPLLRPSPFEHGSQSYQRMKGARAPNVRISLDQSILAGLISQKATLGLSPAEGRPLQGSQDPYNSISSASEPDYLRVPLQGPPENPSDRIVQPFVHKMRALVRAPEAEMDFPSPEVRDPPSPTPRLSPSAVQVEVSRVIADIIYTYPEFDTIAKKVACIMSSTSALTWQILRTKEAYDQMLPWMRPTRLQLEVRHSAWLDRVMWPHARDCLIRDPTITFEQYSDAFAPSFSLNWPYSDDDVILEETDPDTGVKSFHVHPAFEEHVRDMKNWTLTGIDSKFWHTFPQLAIAVEESRKEFGGFRDRRG